MGLYSLMVVNWSIFTLLWIQLIVCASIHTTSSPIQLCRGVSYGNETNESTESVIQMSSSSKESSLVVELNPSDESIESACRQSFIAPPRHVFFVRFFRYPRALLASNRPKMQWTHKRTLTAYREPEYSCPLEITLYNDTITPPWRIDPCNPKTLELGEPPRLQPGQLTFTWRHHGNSPAFKVLLTVLGHGEPCFDASKFTCFGIGNVPILCVSDELTCDGIEHCPLGPDMRSDEDSSMCVDRNIHPNPADMNIWQQLSLNFLKNILGRGEDTEKSVLMSPPMQPPVVTTQRPEMTPPRQKSSFTRGLARYGPWGYLMLGMLVCGAALLMCGLWECCCKRHKPDTEDSTASVDNPSIFIDANRGPTASAPPNYEELDPPPSYSALFPAQKHANVGTSTESLPQTQVQELHDTGGSSRT